MGAAGDLEGSDGFMVVRAMLSNWAERQVCSHIIKHNNQWKDPKAGQTQGEGEVASQRGGGW